jgi:hypothetical protein
MIIFGDHQIRKQALALWKQQATSFEVATLDLRFHHDWLESDVVAFMKESSISAFIMEQKRTVKLGPHHVNVMLVPWCVHDDVQDLTVLLKERLSMHAHQVIASIIISDDEVLMRSLKAKPWILTQSVNLSKSMIEPLSFSMVTFELPLELVAQAYHKFMNRFDSTLIRNIEDFNLPTHSHTFKRKRAGILHEGRVLGYMDYELTPYGVDIREMVYEDIDTLIRCLSFASSLHHHILLHTSSAERLEKLFPQANISKKVESWMVLHHPSLCSELFKQSISESDDLARVLQKPLMMHTR